MIFLSFPVITYRLISHAVQINLVKTTQYYYYYQFAQIHPYTLGWNNTLLKYLQLIDHWIVINITCEKPFLMQIEFNRSSFNVSISLGN